MGRPPFPPGQATTNAERCQRRFQKLKSNKEKLKEHREKDAARKAAAAKEVCIMMKALLLYSSQ